MLKIVGIGLAVILAGILIVAAMRPDTLRVQRAASIKAPPEKVFALINDLRAWRNWSAYETKDPAMKRSLSGPESGKGAVYAWEGNGEVGSGRMEISESTPPSEIRIKLHFLKPFEAHHVAEFHLKPTGGATDVTWVMHGPANYLSKVMGLFFDMDKMIGRDFEAGLANLKALAEK